MAEEMSKAEAAAWFAGRSSRKGSTVGADWARHYSPSDPRQPDPQPTVIEQTAKRYKIHILIGLIGMVGGFFLAVAGCGANAAMTETGTSMFVLGTLYAVVSKVVAWWHHG